MGLDTVELVMMVEEEFEVVISNDAASRVDAVGNLTDLVVDLLRADGRPLPRPEVRARIVAIVRRFVDAPTPLADSVSFVRDLGMD